jgi:membrane protein YqaA with SNARE-associated domain
LLPRRRQTLEEDAMSNNNRWVNFLLAAAGLSFLGSVFCWFLVDHDVGLFIGLWVPSILSLGAVLSLNRNRR